MKKLFVMFSLVATLLVLSLSTSFANSNKACTFISSTPSGPALDLKFVALNKIKKHKKGRLKLYSRYEKNVDTKAKRSVKTLVFQKSGSIIKLYSGSKLFAKIKTYDGGLADAVLLKNSGRLTRIFNKNHVLYQCNW